MRSQWLDLVGSKAAAPPNQSPHHYYSKTSLHLTESAPPLSRSISLVQQAHKLDEKEGITQKQLYVLVLFVSVLFVLQDCPPQSRKSRPSTTPCQEHDGASSIEEKKEAG